MRRNCSWHAPPRQYSADCACAPAPRAESQVVPAYPKYGHCMRTSPSRNIRTKHCVHSSCLMKLAPQEMRMKFLFSVRTVALVLPLLGIFVASSHAQEPKEEKIASL